LQAEASEDPSKRKQLLRALHGRCADLKVEIRERLSHHCTTITMKPVEREYSFEDERVPRRKQWLLKVICDAAPGAVPVAMSGAHFVAVFGTQQTPLEALMLKRRVMGPSWLRVREATAVEPQARVSWCKVWVFKGIHPRVPELPLEIVCTKIVGQDASEPFVTQRHGQCRRLRAVPTLSRCSARSGCRWKR
jgi:DNA polymerase alpha subunit A